MESGLFGKMYGAFGSKGDTRMNNNPSVTGMDLIRIFWTNQSLKFAFEWVVTNLVTKISTSTFKNLKLKVPS